MKLRPPDQAANRFIPGSSQVTSIEWTATGGTISGDGSYTPSGTVSFKVIGRRWATLTIRPTHPS